MDGHTGTRKLSFVAAVFTLTALLDGACVHAAGVPLYPDIVEQISHLQVQNEHQREMLRFSTSHINIGDGPLQVRGGGRSHPA